MFSCGVQTMMADLQPISGLTLAAAHAHPNDSAPRLRRDGVRTRDRPSCLNQPALTQRAGGIMFNDGSLFRMDHRKRSPRALCRAMKLRNRGVER